uniref:hypothetical protein n=1 Tax=Candidatus Scatomorpha intestinigallinarum TaxID=2840923 RepID=UPI00402937A8
MSRAARLIPDRLSQGSTEVFAKFAKLMAFIQLLFVKMYVILQTTCVIGWEKRQKAQSTAVYQPFSAVPEAFFSVTMDARGLAARGITATLKRCSGKDVLHGPKV